jgi:ElaB/YqjD/DUF883 family membrane-anchored ribosome-binding protein|tara:strand:- start:302 stop:526 length:225 start_codon:yes stop_codon:yes gene_type:complete
MSIEDTAIKALQTIVKEVNEILNEMKEKRKDSREINSQDTAKLKEINDLLKNTRKQIIEYINRFNIQTSLDQFN